MMAATPTPSTITPEISSGPVLNWLTFNNGYHGIHHDHPPLHWSLAPEAHRERYGGKIHPGLEQPSLPAYAWTAFILGRRLR